jgi:hypothetical protein
LGEPNAFRLRYRSELAEAVRSAVLGGEAPRMEWFREWAAERRLPPDDLEPFATTGLELLLGLHEHSAARYRIRPAEYRTWRSRFPPAPERAPRESGTT